MSLTLNSSNEELKEKFTNLSTPRDIADLLEVDYSKLVYHVYKSPETSKYKIFSVSKRSGSSRTISAPVTPLKIIQQKLNQVLQVIYQPKAPVHGFVFNKSVVTNAAMHSKQRYVLNLDLQDFFPSINFGRVQGIFQAPPYHCNSKIAAFLAQICCFNNQLPQGAPTSPVVSNMICSKMDSQLRQLAKKNRCVYTRYADDLTFSTFVPKLPVPIAIINSVGSVEIGSQLRQVIETNGFNINNEKMRLQIRNQRQEVTGLTVNKYPNVKRQYVRQIRAMLHAWRKFGLQNAEDEYFSRYDKKYRGPYKERPSFKYIVKGKIEYLGMVRGTSDWIYLHFLKQLKELDPTLVTKSIDPLDKLLVQYEELENSKEPQKRGYILERLIAELLKYYDIPTETSFRRNDNAEQIDGSFSFNGWVYLVECRWRKSPADPSQLDAFLSKVRRSGRQTMGLYLSINGWSKNVITTLKQDSDKNTILMSGDDLRYVLTGQICFCQLLQKKIDKAKCTF